MSEIEIRSVMNRFTLDGASPIEIVVVGIIGKDKATKFYSVLAQYGWAEKILCTGCYLKDANDIAHTIGEFLNISVKDIEEGI